MVASALANPLINSCYLSVPKCIDASIKSILEADAVADECACQVVFCLLFFFHLGILNCHITCTK